jgi:hypothetical protein
MAFGIVDQPGTLTGEIAVDLTQRRPQSAGRRIPFPAAVALEGRHDLADALEGDLGILGLAVPDPPVQAVNFRDDHCLGVLPLRGVDRQGAGCRLGMLQPHGDVKPVEARRLGDAGLDQDRAQPGTAIGEGSQLGISRLADIDKAALDQYLDRSVGSGDGGEDLTAAVRRLDIAKADFEMPLVLLAAPDEG